MSDIEDKNQPDQIEKQKEEQTEAPDRAEDQVSPEEKAEEALEKMEDIEDIIDESLDTNIDTKEKQWAKITENASKIISPESLNMLENEFNKMTPEQAEHVTNLYTKFNGGLDSVVKGLSDEQTKIIEDLNKKYPELLTPSVFGFSSPETFEAVKNIEDPQVKKLLSGIKNIEDISKAKYTPAENSVAPEMPADIEQELPGNEDTDQTRPRAEEEGPKPAGPKPVGQEQPVKREEHTGEGGPVGPIRPEGGIGPREEGPVGPVKPVGPVQPGEEPIGPREEGPVGPVKPEIKPDREYTDEMREQIQHYLKSGDPIPPEIMATFPEATQKALKGLKLSTATGTETLKESYLTKLKAGLEAEAFLITTLIFGARGPEGGSGTTFYSEAIMGLHHVATKLGLPMARQAIKEGLGLEGMDKKAIEAIVNYYTTFGEKDLLNIDEDEEEKKIKPKYPEVNTDTNIDLTGHNMQQ